MSRIFEPFVTPMEEIEDLLVVSASAGTGKTWMITHLAARWLLELDRHPSELLMVTFSRPAAGELKARLRSRLVEIGEVLESLSRQAKGLVSNADVRSEDAWVTALIDRTREIGVDTLLVRFRRIMSQLDEINARTIHSFAAAIRETTESRVAAGGELRRRAVHEVITRHITRADPSMQKLLEYLEGSGAGSSQTPGGERLSAALVSALQGVEGAGGFSEQRVEFWRDDDLPEIAQIAEELLRESWTRLTTLRDLEGSTTFDDLISQLHEELASDAGVLATRLRETFGLVLIDEFQDTDLLQWQIFDRAFRGGPSAVPIIVVGDPKQAIYGFRGGDVRVFQRVYALARDQSSGRKSFLLDLTVNFRSSEGLLNGLNGLFSHANDVAWNFSHDDHDEPVTFLHVEPSPPNRGQPGLLVVRHDEAVNTVNDVLFDDVRAVVRSLIETNGVAPSDIAILAARQFTLARLRRALERDGISTVSAGAVSVWLSEAATQLRTLLWMLADARDPRRNNLRAMTWFAGLSDDSLALMAYQLERFGTSALARYVLDGAVLSLLRSSSEAQRQWTDLEHLCELLAERAPGPRAPSQLLATFDEFVADAESGDERDDDAQRRVESDDESVKLMTIHASKGLQFPIVLIADVEHGARSRGVSSWTTPTGRRFDTSSLVGAGSSDTPAARARADEARRLIYVALTRGERLAVLWANNGAKQWAQLAETWVPTEELGARREGFIGSLQVDGAILGRPRTLQRLVAPALRERPQMNENLRRWSYSALTLRAEDDARIDAAGSSAFDAGAWGEDHVAREISQEDRDLFDGLSGTSLGNAVHRVFEECVGRISSTDAVALRHVIECAWREHSLPVPSADVLATFSTLLSRPLGALFDAQCLDDFVGTTSVAKEMRFTMPLSPFESSRLSALCSLVARDDPHGPFVDFFAQSALETSDSHQLWEGFLTGSIDLVAQIGSGDKERYVIVDYKSNLLVQSSSYEPNDLTREMVHSGYPLQGLLYSIALHRYLRGRWRDYDPNRHLAGLCYLYVRGAARAQGPQSGLATWVVPAHVIVAASNLLAGVQ
jgi:exodeoxyribonuclease V beta subunit